MIENENSNGEAKEKIAINIFRTWTIFAGVDLMQEDIIFQFPIAVQ